MTIKTILYGMTNILFGIWILYTGVAVAPLVVDVAFSKSFVEIIYNFSIAVCSIYFCSKGVYIMMTGDME